MTMKRLELDNGKWLEYEGIPKEEALAYFELYDKKALIGIEWMCVWLEKDGDKEVNLTYMPRQVEFECIRRITEYP